MCRGLVVVYAVPDTTSRVRCFIWRQGATPRPGEALETGCHPETGGALCIGAHVELDALPRTALDTARGLRGCLPDLP